MAAGTSGESTMVIVLAISVLLLYFVPTLCAFCLRHHHRKAILLINLLTGWTLIGWAVAAVWSSTATRPHPPGNAAPVTENEATHRVA